MFDHFPKARPSLPEAIARLYEQQYKSNRDGGSTAASLAQKMEAWMHRQVANLAIGAAGNHAAPIPNPQSPIPNPQSPIPNTLELGAGTLNQLQYEPTSQNYDIVEPFQALYTTSPLLTRVRHQYASIHEILGEAQYDRITSIAVLEHICDLPALVARSGLLLQPQGIFQAAIPNEGTWLWTLGWKLTTGIEFRIKHKLDYGKLMRHEHVNTADEIEEVLHYFFKRVRCKVFGISKSTAFYRYYACAEPRRDRCLTFAPSAGKAL